MKIGKGFYIGHGIGIVINPGTIIGDNCNISHFLSIGTNHNTPAVIGNNVYIGPGAIIFGDIEIADNVSIGANATVNKSVLEPNSVVAGTPAKVVKTDVESWNGVK